MIEKITGLLFSFLGIGFVALAILTMVPTDILGWGASKPSMLGYYTHCSFAPISTTILFVLSAVFIPLGLRMFRKP